MEPEEIAKITWAFYRKNTIEGLFLSSGVLGDPETTASAQLEVARILRDQGFPGYLHMRVMPGTPRDLLEQIAEHANKFGVNAETTNSLNYSELCPNFDYKNDILQRLKWTRDIIREKRKEYSGAGRFVGANDTQFVVGAADESDRDVLRTVNTFMDRYDLRRPYFMSFDPVPDTPLENGTPSPKWREQRLYQASYLLKDYGIISSDLDPIYDESGLLSNMDPKLRMAQLNSDMFPVDINSASLHELLLVPGIGPVSAGRILRTRPVQSEDQLSRMGVVITHARPYISINGSRQTNLFTFTGAGS